MQQALLNAAGHQRQPVTLSLVRAIGGAAELRHHVGRRTQACARSGLDKTAPAARASYAAA